MAPPVQLRHVDRHNWLACARLELRPDQAEVVAPNVYSIAEWHFQTHYSPRAIYYGEDVVGFLMYCPETDPHPDCLYWLFRFMIASEHQGRGFGRAALAAALAEMRVAGATRVRTMHKPSNRSAAKLYAAFGFDKVGDLEDGDVELELRFDAERVG